MHHKKKKYPENFHNYIATRITICRNAENFLMARENDNMGIYYTIIKAYVESVL